MTHELEAAIEEAIACPMEADVGELCVLLDSVLETLSPYEQLAQGGVYIAQIAEICWLRADRLANDQPESFEELDLSSFFRQSLSLPTEQFSHPVPKRIVQKAQPNKPLKPLPQKTVEAWIESAEEQRKKIFSLSHDENVEVWSQRIGAALDGPMSFAELRSVLTDVPWIEVWMGVLLGGFEVEILESNEFYNANFIVRTPSDAAR
ncbi:MAG: hypothetical protein KME20_01245 [Kaiparowitsia implicata GSE-PSE-MK54-09C]|jgi:hypothetical protein|nr:hypothetical protein [Kaiparowitsia implicata GSE-PSE-MK54-09C]